ncbi:MAG TPA: DUF1254 domain-containing protein [Sphingopyxis sp.]|nr:DUF1254 domain-containing protein [Sphingopyxis sp.]
MIRTLYRFVAFLAMLAGIAAATPVALAQALTPAEARQIAREAYIYGFPMVDHYRVQHAYFVNRTGAEYKGAWNRIHNEARVYTPKDRAIHTPNADTPYSMVGADLRAEPLVLSMPRVGKDRYYVVQFVDLYTHNFDYVGTRSTGNGEGRYLLAGPGWKGPTPRGIKRVIRAETDLVFLFYRTQLFSPSDIANVKRVQAGFGVETLSHYLGVPPPPASPPIAFVEPLSAAEERTSPHFFGILDFLLRELPVHPAERDMRARFARLGVGGTGRFDYDAMTPELQRAVREGMADAWQAYAGLSAQIEKGEVGSGDIVGTRDHLAGRYLNRMAAAVRGIYGNSKEEAVYIGYPVDAAGQKTDGRHRYRLRFAPGELPPVRSFWSLTMYELPDRMLVENPLERYLINSAMLPALRRDPDGGITLEIGHETPGSEREANWLPAPDGPFLVILRAYWPTGALADGSWKKPPLERIP